MVIEIVLVGIFVLGCAAALTGLVVSIVKNRGARPDSSWQDDLKDGDVRLPPGAGGGNVGATH